MSIRVYVDLDDIYYEMSEETRLKMKEAAKNRWKNK